MPKDACVKPEDKIRHLAKEMIDKFGKAALHEATQRRNRYESCGLSSDALTWRSVCAEIRRNDDIDGYRMAQTKGVMLSE